MIAQRISECIGEIDVRYVEEAFTYEIPARIRSVRWLKRVAAMACVFLAIVCSPILLNLFGFKAAGPNGATENEEMENSPNNMPEANKNPMEVGEKYTFQTGMYEGTTVYYKSYKDNKLTLILEKKECENIYFYISGNYIRSEWTDENGKPVYDLTHYYASTNPDYYKNYGERIENAFIFTVNGKIIAEFPKEVGEYEIIVDFSLFAEHCNDFDPYLNWSYGALYIEEYAYSE